MLFCEFILIKQKPIPLDILLSEAETIACEELFIRGILIPYVIYLRTIIEAADDSSVQYYFEVKGT